MPKINLLDKSVYELIAAGEVIERPSSVIKELAENSIDAGAASITVEIKRGGISYLRVTDDGCGISDEDIPTAFMRHATSKVYTQDDLDSINTLGFRGEALASVCAVSRVEALTKQREDQLGSIYRIEAGEPVEYDRAGARGRHYNNNPRPVLQYSGAPEVPEKGRDRGKLLRIGH